MISLILLAAIHPAVLQMNSFVCDIENTKLVHCRILPGHTQEEAFNEMWDMALTLAAQCDEPAEDQPGDETDPMHQTVKPEALPQDKPVKPAIPDPLPDLKGNYYIYFPLDSMTKV